MLPTDLDLEAYFARTGYAGPRAATPAVLRALHQAHASSIPFENLAIQLGELPLRLDLGSLQDKLVRRRRGGYCFEQNLLFRAVLEAFGFPVTPCDARVRFGNAELLPRTHLLLEVEAEGRSWLCDVGFGGEGLLHPVPLDGTAQDQFGRAYRVVPEGPLRVLQGPGPSGWRDFYAWTPGPVQPPDWEMANWYTSTHPESRFVQTLTAQRPTPEARHILRNRTYQVIRNGVAETRELEEAEVPKLLREVFGLDVPEGARFRAFQNR